MKLILVLVKTEGAKGSVTIACTGMQQDPLFPNKLVLTDIQGLSWPFQGKFIKVEQWSIDKDAVLNWMVGPLRDTFDITLGMTAGEGQEVPWPPGTTPNTELVNHSDEVRAMSEPNAPEATPKAETPVVETPVENPKKETTPGPNETSSPTKSAPEKKAPEKKATPEPPKKAAPIPPPKQAPRPSMPAAPVLGNMPPLQDRKK